MHSEPQPPAPSLPEWLRAARTPYLNFLRNLTPQVFLASLAWVVASKLDFSKPDFSNWAQTSGFYIFLALFGFSAYSNISIFLSELFPGLIPWLRKYQDSLKTANVSRMRVPVLLFKAAMKERKLEIPLAVLAVIMLQFVVAGVIAASIGAAVSFIRTTHG